MVAVLDWELSTLGHPLADLAYFACRIAWAASGTASAARIWALGIPSEHDFVAAYCRRVGRRSIPDWDWYIVFGMFRLAAIAQGIMGRVIAGTANDPHARSRGERAQPLADAGWTIVQNKSRRRPDEPARDSSRSSEGVAQSVVTGSRGLRRKSRFE